MKTKLTLAIMFLFAITILSGGNLEASNKNDTLAIKTKILPIPPDENYIDDIPFNTELVALNSLLKFPAASSSEEYINDIPFNTEIVVALHNYAKVYLYPEIEGYVDDIPFETSEVVANMEDCEYSYVLKKENKCGD